MTNEERDLITQFIQRVGGVPARPAGGFGGSVPSTVPTVQALPPIDREADALIGELMQRYPEARYRLTQMAFVQEHALAEAQNTINRLQWELDQARAQQAPAMPAASPWGAAAQPQPQPSRGMFGGLFGGRQSAPPAPPPGYGQSQGYGQPQFGAQPPQPVYPPGYQPGMYQQRGGSGFLGSALTTAAGVAGGMVVGNMLMNAFSGGGAAHAASAAAAASPWTAPTAATDPYAQGGEPKDGGWQDATPSSYQNTGGQDAGGQDSGWQDTADSGWTDQGYDDEEI
jgi:hypothetical protein